jgi:tetratricopeptide (TPR) repeat protein
MPGVFDHVIVRATIGGETLWLDGTSSGTRLADLNDVPPFRNALPLREAGATMVAMPMRPSARPDTDVEIEYDSRAGIGFPSPFTLKASIRGATATMLRMMAGQMGREKALEFAESVIAGYISNGQVTSRDLRDDPESGAMIVTGSGIASPDWSKDSGRFRLVLDRAVGEIAFDPNRARAEWKDIPVGTGDPRHTSIRTRIRLPGGGQGFEFEGDTKLPETLAGVVVSRTAALEGEWLTVADRYVTGVNEIAPADIAAARAQLATAQTHLLKLAAPSAVPARWRQIAAAKKAKSFDPILALYAKRIAEDPKKPEGYAGRASFLESIYDYPAAMKDVDRLIAVSPSSDYHLWRARLWQAQGDDKKALADVAAARKLDPASPDVLAQFATLSAHAGGAPEALALVEERVAAGGKEKDRFVLLQADLLADSGRAAEAIAVLDAAISAKPGNTTLLNQRCWIKATANLHLDTALKDCTKAIELSENAAHIFDSRGLVYFRMGRDEEALADFDAALDAAPDQAASLFMRGLTRKRMGAQGADEDLAAARMIAPRVDAEYARYGIRP